MDRSSFISISDNVDMRSMAGEALAQPDEGTLRDSDVSKVRESCLRQAMGDETTRTSGSCCCDRNTSRLIARTFSTMRFAKQHDMAKEKPLGMPKILRGPIAQTIRHARYAAHILEVYKSQ